MKPWTNFKRKIFLSLVRPPANFYGIGFSLTHKEFNGGYTTTYSVNEVAKATQFVRYDDLIKEPLK